MLDRLNSRDVGAGVVFILVALAFLFMSRDYQLGSMQHMGPAYFPMALSICLLLIGIACIARSFTTQSLPIGRLAIKPMILVTLGTVAFALLIRSGGMALAVAALVITTSFANRHLMGRQGIILALVLTIACPILFIHGLGLPFQTFGPLLHFFGR